MDCDICQRAHDPQKLPFLCAVDARNQLYEPRLMNARVLLEREALENQANSALAGPNQLEGMRSEQQLAADRTAQIVAKAERLREEVEAARREVAARREALERKHSDLASVSSGVDARRARQLGDMDKAIQLSRYKWKRVADTTASNRAYLCMEAARLYGLRRIRKASSARYELGHVEIIELLGMNSASPELISTSLANVAHILVLASHYLAIRLPAEITLPRREYPRPTIFSLASSYQYPDVPFPGTGNFALQVSSRDPEPQHLPRPRPLYVDKPLPALAKDDPAAYSLFVEGVTLLAYDIAWACCSQGIAFGDRDEDMCNMGQNLYRLLIGNQLHGNQAAQLLAASTTAGEGDEVDKETLVEVGKTQNLMGRYSHGTAHAFLGSAQGAEFVRSFKLPNPIKIADRLKKRLMSEAPMHEWETIETEDAVAEEDEEGDGILVKGQRRKDAARGLFDVESVATVDSVDPTTAATTTTAAAGNGKLPPSPKTGDGRPRMLGTNGWTKLKPR